MEIGTHCKVGAAVRPGVLYCKPIFRTNCVRCDRGAYKKEPAGLIDPAVTAPSSQRRLTNEQKVDPLWLQMNPLRIPVPTLLYTIFDGLSIDVFRKRKCPRQQGFEFREIPLAHSRVPWTHFSYTGYIRLCQANWERFSSNPVYFPSIPPRRFLAVGFVLWMGTDTNWYQFVSVCANLCYFASAPSFSACTAATVLRNLCDETRWASRYKQA